jgi:hypothetical protein
MIHCVHRVHTPEAELLEATNETEVLLFDADENKDASIVME